LDNQIEQLKEQFWSAWQALLDSDQYESFNDLLSRHLYTAFLLPLLLPLLCSCMLFSAIVITRPSREPPATPMIQLAAELENAKPSPVNETSRATIAPTQTPLPNAVISTRMTAEPLLSASPETMEVTSTKDDQSFFPVLSGGDDPTTTPTPSPTGTTQPTPTPTIDFRAVRERLRSQGQDLGFVKIGFHTAVGGNRNGLGDWMRRLDSTGVPFFLKSADDAGPLYEAQQIVRESDVPHTLVYRRSGDEYDTPDYDLPPEQAARQHWELHKAVFPSELDPQIVWIETINEVDKDRSEWLGYFAIETARLAMEDGFRWAAFGWSSGEPETNDWTSPSMLEFLRLAGDFPDRIAIALHEYSYISSDIAHEYPFKVGRFQQLFEIVDRNGIPRPTVLVTEWGWEYADVPSIDEALRDIEWAAAMYAPYPEIKGAAVWYLGGGYEDIAVKAQRLLLPLTEYSMGNYYAIPLPPDVAPIDPEQYRP
jgi:hypothetical protein